MKRRIFEFLFGLLMFVPFAASASPFTIALTETGVGDPGADWFGTFDAPSTGGLATSFSITINGTVYDALIGVAPAAYSSADYLDGFVRASANNTLALQFWGGSGSHYWSIGNCPQLDSCGGFRLYGTYELAPANVVPEPGSLALVCLGLLALGAGLRREAVSPDTPAS